MYQLQRSMGTTCHCGLGVVEQTTNTNQCHTRKKGRVLRTDLQSSKELCAIVVLALFSNIQAQTNSRREGQAGCGLRHATAENQSATGQERLCLHQSLQSTGQQTCHSGRKQLCKSSIIAHQQCRAVMLPSIECDISYAQ